MECTPKTQYTRPGRPAGSVIFDRDSFMKSAPEVYAKILSRDAEHPCQNVVARRLGIGRATLNRYLVSYGTSWGEIRQLAMRKWLEYEGY
jgi:hypothetical protein